MLPGAESPGEPQVTHRGKPRRLGGGSRAWRATGYDGPRPLVRLKNPENDYRWTSWYPNAGAGETLASLFEQTEAYLDEQESGHAAPTVGFAAEQYLLSIDGPTSTMEDDSKDNRRSLVRKWIVAPVGAHDPFGHQRVDSWTRQDSVDFLRRVADTGHLGERRLEDLRTLLAAVRDVCYDLGWMTRDLDPLRKVKVPRVPSRSLQGGASASHVPEAMRPQTASVRTVVALAREARARGPRALPPLILLVGAFCGLRLSEQLGVAVEDLDLVRHRLNVRGAWLSPRGRSPYWRPWTKNREVRWVPYPESMHADVLDAIRSALGLPADIELAQVQSGQAELALEFTTWYDLTPKARAAVPMPVRHYLFPDPVTGIPWEQEEFNRQFRALRSLSQANARANARIVAWPTHIPYRNARHHAAMWWRTHLPAARDEGWTVVARMLGNRPETCRRYYVVLGDRAMADIESSMRSL